MHLPSGLDDASLKCCRSREHIGLNSVKRVKELIFPLCLGACTMDLDRPVKSRISYECAKGSLFEQKAQRVNYFTNIKVTN